MPYLEVDGDWIHYRGKENLDPRTAEALREMMRAAKRAVEAGTLPRIGARDDHWPGIEPEDVDTQDGNRR
jgi:hypothetical protein